MRSACSVSVRGVVQGVGFRPFVYRLARANTLVGWVRNDANGVEIRIEGTQDRLECFLRDLADHAPTAATIVAIDVVAANPIGLDDFTIKESDSFSAPITRISPDLCICDDCLRELFEPTDRRYRYPFINCTNCGPRYSIITALPYDRAHTTMQRWQMDAYCADEYHDPENRRFHAQPVACPDCGPHLSLIVGDGAIDEDDAVVSTAATLLNGGGILAIKGIGGYHLACDARNAKAVSELRERKFRKEKPFALMVRDESIAEWLVALDDPSRVVLRSAARPIVLAPALMQLPGVAPETGELGVMLPYAPLHHLLFAAGAPPILVMTSANRSSEPIAYQDDDARQRLEDIADAYLVGERPIARRVEDSVVRATPWGTTILRRSRGFAPGAVTTIPATRPILALGADLKNAITLVVDGQAFVSQHIGDLSDYDSFRAFEETVADLLAMYQVNSDDVIVAHDLHPEYRSTQFALASGAAEHRAIQHHRAHVASVIAERGAWETRALGVSFDGTGYGDDGTIWGGEFFVGSVAAGFDRVAHIRQAALAGGDAAARFPVQAAAGFLSQIGNLPALDKAPFNFDRRFRDAQRLLTSGTRTFTTTSVGRLFDCAAALLGFTREVTFEGQAAIWLEQLGAGSASYGAYDFPFAGGQLDWRPTLQALAKDRSRQIPECDIARAFQRAIALGIWSAVTDLCVVHNVDTVVLSGGVFQNATLLGDLADHAADSSLQLWTNHAVPPNDGGISLGQAALAAFGNG